MYLTKTEKKIVELCKNSEYSLQPSEISEKRELNPSTVRVLCRRLLKKGYLYQPIPEFYDYLSPHGDDNVSPLLVHDLRLVASVSELRGAVKRSDVEYVDYGAKVGYCFGGKNGKFTVSISDSRGIGYYRLKRILGRVRDDAEGYFGRELEYNCSFHLNRDLNYRRLDNFQSITIGVLDGWFKRVYQKEDSLRVEIGVNNCALDELFSMLLHNFDLHSFCFSIRRQIDNTEKTCKETNRAVADLRRELYQFMSQCGGFE